MIRSACVSPYTRVAGAMAVLLASTTVVSAQPGPLPPAAQPPDDARAAWTTMPEMTAQVLAKEAWIRPLVGQALELDTIGLRAALAAAPMEGPWPVSTSPAIIALPRPDGTFERFAFVESPIMEPALAAQFPGIKTYLGQSLDHPGATTRFDLTPEGFHAQVIIPGETAGSATAYAIDPASKGDDAHYTSYWRGSLRGIGGFRCTTPNIAAPAIGQGVGLRGGEVMRRIVRTAVAATGEYTTFVSPAGNPNAASGLSAITSAINRVNQVYEIDLAVRLVLVANETSIIYTDPTTDPYSGTLSDMQGQNQSNLDTQIGNGNYDLGHLFDQRVGGGNAGGIGTVCNNGNKGTGFTGAGAPTGDFFWIDYVAHEMGHQLGGTHTFNNCGDNSQRTGSTAYEPGSGITIMGYAGICGADDLATASPPTGASIPSFNFSSIDQIRAKVNEGGTCLAAQSTGNFPPSLPGLGSITMPIRTPFTLTGLGASDSGGSASLTYSWEEADLGSAVGLGPDTGVGAPLFRPYPPVASLSRTFPAPASIGGPAPLGENLVQFARTSTFTLLVRDNSAGAGGVDRANMTVNFVDSDGFSVTGPAAGELQCDFDVTVAWNTGGTEGAPVNCPNVDIFYSTDAGVTYPFNLGTFPNDGSQNVTVPAVYTATARFLVRGHEVPFLNAGPVFTFDLTPPTITCPTNITRSNDPGQCGAAVGFDVVANDNCPGVTVACRIGAAPVTSPYFFPVGLTTVDCTATDAGGRTDECSFTVRVNDTEPPVVSAVAAVVALDEYGNATLTPETFSASATDNCLAPDCPVTLSLSQSVFLCPPVNVPIDVTVIGADCHDNTGSIVTTVTFPDPDCNQNGLPDICDILSGRSKDCDGNRVPDECQCVWDGGDPPTDLADAAGQISHLGGGSGPGAKVADDMYIEPGLVVRIFEFKGVMLTDLIPGLRKARLELFADCDGRPAGTPLYTFENPTWTEDAGPNADGFYLVTYTFDLCDDQLWLDGGRTYWWSLTGLGTCDGLDLSSWVASTSRVAGSPPMKTDGLPPVHCWAENFGEWSPLDACCIGCVNMSYKVVGQSCPIIWNNGPAIVAGPGAGGIRSETLSPSQRWRGADDFVVKPCDDQKVCLIDAWVWSNCDPVRGFVEVYNNDCRVPGSLVASLTDPQVIPTGDAVTIDGTLRRGYILRFAPLDLTLPPLPGGRTYWLSAGADRTGSQNARTYFAFGSRCDACPRSGFASQSSTPPAPVNWSPVGPDLAFRIAGAPPEIVIPTLTAPPPTVCAADVNHSGEVTVQDIFDFLGAYFAGCP